MVYSAAQAARENIGYSIAENWFMKDKDGNAIDKTQEGNVHYAGRLVANSFDTTGRIVRDTLACFTDALGGTLANTLYLLPLGKVHEGTAKFVAEHKVLLNNASTLPARLLDNVLTLNPDMQVVISKELPSEVSVDDSSIVTQLANGIKYYGSATMFDPYKKQVTETFTKAAHGRVEEKLSAYDPSKAEGWVDWSVNQVAFRAIATIGLVYSAAARIADSAIGLANYAWAAVNLGNNAEANTKAHDSLNIIGAVSDTFKFVERMIYANEGSIKS